MNGRASPTAGQRPGLHNEEIIAGLRAIKARSGQEKAGGRARGWSLQSSAALEGAEHVQIMRNNLQYASVSSQVKSDS